MYCLVYVISVALLTRADSFKTLRSPALLANSSSHLIATTVNETALNSNRGPFDVLWFGWDGVNRTQEWEYDYLRELFPAPYFRHTNNSSSPSVTTCRRRRHTQEIETKFLGLEPPSLIGRWLGYKPTEKTGTTVSAKKLRVVVHLGDEDMGMNTDKLSCVNLFPQVPLALRQYALPSTTVSSSAITSGSKNMLQIPLAYMVGYLRDNVDELPAHTSVQYAQWSLSRNSSARNMKWSFVGSLHGAGKAEREHAIKVFSGWSPHLSGVKVPPTKLRHVYNDSLFVLSGRGIVTHDCSRLYESTIAGAIPIVVGPSAELNHAFNYDGEKPPFLYASTWEEALKIAMKMSNSEIDSKREELVRWYSNRMNTIKRKIQRVFGLPQLQTSLPQQQQQQLGGSSVTANEKEKIATTTSTSTTTSTTTSLLPRTPPSSSLNRSSAVSSLAASSSNNASSSSTSTPPKIVPRTKPITNNNNGTGTGTGTSRSSSRPVPSSNLLV